ncbi:hypothetical protein AAE478_004892 [Parahypoxylon ruwenzoriense]
MSPNIQESDTSSRKRTHDEFVDSPIQLIVDEPAKSENFRVQKSITMPTSSINLQSQLPLVPIVTVNSTPGSSPVALTEAGSSPPNRDSPSPNKTPSTSPGPKGLTAESLQLGTSLSPAPVPANQNPQLGKRKLTTAQEQIRTEKRQKKEEEAAEKRQKKQEEATQRQQKKEEEAAKRAAKAAEKAAEKALKQAAEEVKRRKKEEEELAAKRKREKQQSVMANFIQRASAASSKGSDKPAIKLPEPDAVSAIPQAETKPQKSAYERVFQPFFVKPGVTLARSPFYMDEETKEAKSAILDQYIRGERGEFNPKPFNPAETFNLPFRQRRGIRPPSVKRIMERVYGSPVEQALSMAPSRTESQTEKLIVNAQDQLKSVPMKYLSFYEDVRPPYFGTVTTPMETKRLRRLSRKPFGRVLKLEYDYDSEAEWVEDDGEDLDDDEEDEEDHDGDEEMDDFLDDSEDVPAAARPTFLGEKEPTSTGICFENEQGLAPCAATSAYRLEILRDTLEQGSGIDPFSTSYWPSAPKKTASKNTAAPVSGPSASMPAPGGPTDAFSLLISGIPGAAPAIDPKDVVPKEVFDDFRRAVVSDEFREFTKGTIVEMLAKKFSSCTKAQVRATLDRIAQRVSVAGAKKSVKQWALLTPFAS